MSRWWAHQLRSQFQTQKQFQPPVDWAIDLFGLHPVSSTICLFQTLKQSFDSVLVPHSCSLRLVRPAQGPSQWPGRNSPRDLAGVPLSTHLAADLLCADPTVSLQWGPCPSTSPTDKGPGGSVVSPGIR